MVRKWILFYVLLLLVNPLIAEQIKISGVSENEVLIEGKKFKVGDFYEETEIITVGDGYVIFKDKQGKAFTQEVQVSFLDKVKKKIKTLFKKENKDEEGFLEGVAKKINFNTIPKKDLPLDEKINLAEGGLIEFRHETNTFFSNMQVDKKLTPRELTKKVDDYNKIMDKYTSGFNALGLPCPRAGNTKSDLSLEEYRLWADDFQRREKTVMEGCNQKINQLLK